MGGKFSLTFFTLLSLFLLSFFDVLFLFLSPLQSIPFPYFFSLYPPPLFFSLQSNFEILLSQLLPITPPQTPPSLFFCSQQTLKIILIGTFYFFFFVALLFSGLYDWYDIVTFVLFNWREFSYFGLACSKILLYYNLSLDFDRRVYLRERKKQWELNNSNIE